jgi:stearoyl-CoA desaturase (delta-9 desaturase)
MQTALPPLRLAPVQPALAESAAAAAENPLAKFFPPYTEGDERFNRWTSIPYVFVHAAGLIGGAVTIAYGQVTWVDLLLCGIFYYLRMFGITAGYHRYFSHRAYKTGRIFQFILAFIGTTSLQKGVLWWAAHHRQHHKHSDQERDIHSPVTRSFGWAHQGWFLCGRYDRTDWERIQDFAKYPELRWLNTNFRGPAIGSVILMFLVGWLVRGDVMGGLRVGLWGGFISTVLLWHGTFTINSLAHVWGSRRYKTSDDSRNNFFLALITMGEGWHNNHHHYQSTANQGFFWWEVDFSYYILKALSWVGIVWDLRTPPKHILENRAANPS